MRPDGQFHTTPKFDHEIPDCSHLGNVDHITKQCDEMNGHNVREFWIERHLTPARDLQNRLSLNAQFRASAGQNCESPIEADTGDCLTLQVQVHPYHPAGRG
ncbi:hypothetical protein SAURM35S_08372 [Streptomyces aurantiogriseus]